MFCKVAGMAAAVVLAVLFLQAPAREELRLPPRAAGLPGPVIVAPRHRQLAARPILHLLALDADAPLSLEIRRNGRTTHYALEAGMHAWPRAEKDLGLGEVVGLLLRSDTGVDLTEVWLAAPREPALWERGGKDAATRLAASGFPGLALMVAAHASTLAPAAALRVGLPSSLRLMAPRAWTSGEETRER
jgi:hypothetical protein